MNTLQYMNLAVKADSICVIRNPYVLEAKHHIDVDDWCSAVTMLCQLFGDRIFRYEDLVLRGFEGLFQVADLDYDEQYLSYGDFSHQFSNSHYRVDPEKVCDVQIKQVASSHPIIDKFNYKTMFWE